MTDGEKKSFADLLEESTVPTERRYQVGDSVSGPIVHVSADAIFVDLGGRGQAEYSRVDFDGEPVVGETIKGVVLAADRDGSVKIGKALSRGMSLEQLMDAMEQKTAVQGKVSGVNRGGVSVDLGGLRAFCPMSQLDVNFVRDASVFLQQTHSFHITKVEEGGKNVVLSRRSILEIEQRAEREKLVSAITPGSTLDGKIASVRDFGAFVDIGGGIQGLIPTRELSHDRRRPDSVVSVGDLVRVQVLSIEKDDKKGQRVTLSLKALAADPWDAVAAVAPIGQVVGGVVRKLMDFGAFVELRPGVEGLLHVSELGGGGKHPSAFLSVGQPITVVVQSVDRGKKRISLAPAPENAAVGATVTRKTVAAGSVVEAEIVEHARFGVFAQIEGATGRSGRGLIPTAELDVPHGTDLRREFPVGAKVKCKVLQTGDRIRLSIKAAKADETRAEYLAFQERQGSTNMGTFGDLLKKKLGK